MLALVKVLIGALIACSSPQHPAHAGLPAEVTALTERWEMCWHFAGEEPYDAARAQEIAEGGAKWCPGNEGERDRLRAKYKGDPDVQDALRKLDEMK